MKAALVMFKPDGERRDFPVSKPIVVLGRKHTCDLRIPLSSVSREHAQVERRPDGFYIRDLGSSNGTYHNEQRVHEQKLEPGDTIVIGPVHFTVVIDGRPGVVEPVATVLPEGSRVMAAADASGGSRSGHARSGDSRGVGTTKDRAVVADPSKGKVAEREDEEVAEQELIEAMEVEFEDAEEADPDEDEVAAVKDRPETPADPGPPASPDAPTGIPGGESDGENDPIAALESLASASESEDRDDRSPSENEKSGAGKQLPTDEAVEARDEEEDEGKR